MYSDVQCIPQIPSAFMHHDDVRFVLGEIIEGFHHEEKEAILFFYVLGTAVQEIANVTQLLPNHVTCVLNLYAERLHSRLCFFKKFVPYDASELIPASEILFSETPV